MKSIHVAAALALFSPVLACQGAAGDASETPVRADVAPEHHSAKTPTASTPAATEAAAPRKDSAVNTVPAPEDVAAPPADATTTASGLAYKVLQAGTGADHPGPTSNVTVHYSGWTTDGKMFDSSVVRGQTISFPLNGVIAGWTEGVQLMVTGEKSRFWIPAAMAYGETPRRPGAPAGMLVFDIELFAIR